MKHIKLVIHKLSGSRDNYGTVSYNIDIPDHYTYIDLAIHIVTEKYLESEGLVRYLERDGNFVYDFFEDYQDSAVIKNLDDVIPAGSRVIFSPNYYNYPKDPAITLNYVYIRKDMRNMRWKKYIEKLNATDISNLSEEVGLLMRDSDFEYDIPQAEMGSICWSASFMGWIGGNKGRK